MMKDLVIIGAGGFGREVAELVCRINQNRPTWNLLGFLDENKAIGSAVGKYSVLGNLEWLDNHINVFVACAVGTGHLRKNIMEKLSKKTLRIATLIDPSVIITGRCLMGEGSIICAGSILTTDIKLGKYVIINLSCTVGHDTILHDFCTVHPGVNISGQVEIDECVDFGTGTKVIQGKHICKNVTFGAGSVIVTDIEEPGTYVGVPAKKQQRRVDDENIDTSE